MAHPLATVSNLRYELLSKQLEIPADKKEFFEAALRGYNDDYWLDGKGSLLPTPSGAFESDISKQMEKRFVFRNVIREVVERVSKAYFGRSPGWTYDTEVDKESLALLDKLLGDWWSQEAIFRELILAFEHRLSCGYGGVRMYIPRKYVKTNDAGQTYVTFQTPQEALSAIRVEFIDPDRARMLKDDGDLFSIVQYSVRKDWETNKFVNVIEYSYVDDAGLTFIGVVEEKGETQSGPPNSAGFHLDEQSTFFELTGQPYITKAMYKNNQLLNLALTCAGFSIVDNGFGEVFLTNVNMETKMVQQPDGTIGEVPVRLRRGGGLVQNLMGIENMTDEGAISVQQPGVHFKDPTPIAVFKDGKDLAYTGCLEEVGQLYAKISGDATASGESRIQAMRDFYLRIVDYKPEVDMLGGWALNTALRWAFSLSQTTAPTVKIVFDSKIFLGEVSKEERELLIQQYKDGVISLETCRVLSGVEDPTVESETIQRESDVILDDVPISEAKNRVELANQMIGLLPDRRIRKIAFGYDDAQLDEIDEEFQEQAENSFPGLAEPGGPEDPEIDEENPDDGQI